MDSAAWKSVFQGIRAEDQRSVVVRTADALEVAVEKIERLETDIVMIRGRIAGSADSRRLFLIPYPQLSAVYINRAVASEEVGLFSPSISDEEKANIAKHVQEMAQKAQDQAKQAEAEINAGKNGISNDMKSQLEELRRTANFGSTPPAASKPQEKAPETAPPPAQSKPAPTSESNGSKRLALPPAPGRPSSGRVSLPEPPRR